MSGPILIWQPEGGVSGGPITSLPVYSQAGTTQLVEGQAYVDVVFGSIQTNDEWVLVDCHVENETDLEWLNIWPGIITDRTAAGFRLYLNGMPDSGNYYLHWAVSGVNIAPSEASTYYLTGPTTGAVGEAATFTVSLPPSTTISGNVTITPDDSGVAGVFSPTSVELTMSSASATFTYTPASYGDVTISTTNSSTLTDPASVIIAIPVPTYTLIGPSTGESGVASTDFTVELSGGVVGTVTVTPSDGGGGGTFTPTTVALTTLAPSDTFTYTPASTGTKTISVTNDGGLTDPANLTYTATPPPFDPSTITGCKLWLKADSLALSDGAAVSTWPDSSGLSNDATQATAGNKPIYKTSIVNGKPVVRFDGTDDWLALTSAISFAASADLTAVVVYQSAGDNCLVGATTANNQILRVGETALNKLSFWDGATGGASSTLSVARTAWNIVLVQRSATFISFYDTSGFLNNAGVVAGAVKVESIGTLGFAVGAIPTNGDIAEVLVYDNAVSSGDISDIAGYLRTKYAIP